MLFQHGFFFPSADPEQNPVCAEASGATALGRIYIYIHRVPEERGMVLGSQMMDSWRDPRPKFRPTYGPEAIGHTESASLTPGPRSV
jgi:hypothetical protein